jgi:hypothetical protein
MIADFTIDVVPADKKADDCFVEFARLRGDYLFDKIFIREFTHTVQGVRVLFDYERNATRLRDVPPSIIPPNDWAVSRELANQPDTAAGKQTAWAGTQVIQRLFAEGARFYNEKNQKAEVSFAADAEFIAALGA